MRLLVTGANGQVGWELSRCLMPLGDVVALDHRQCDLLQPELLPSLIRSIKPDVIVNAAAYTAVDKAEQEEKLATTINGTAVGLLAEESRKAGILLVHYSTDYVFDGVKDTPYTEDDVPHPINAYGRSKLAGDIYVRQAGGAYIILRTSWVYARRRQNFLRTILRLAGKGGDLRIVDDQIGAPTWARNIADATALIVQTVCHERLQGNFSSGLFNLTASGATSWHGFAKAILKDASKYAVLSGQPLPQLKPIPSEAYPSPAARPKNSRLTEDRLRERIGIVLPDWRQSLSLCIEEMKACEQFGTRGPDAAMTGQKISDVAG
jgi:dTDP-4-dehydrorhamnose reductase